MTALFPPRTAAKGVAPGLAVTALAVRSPSHIEERLNIDALTLGCRSPKSRIMQRQTPDAETTDAFNKASGGTGKLTEPQFAAFVGLPADDPTISQLFKESVDTSSRP